MDDAAEFIEVRESSSIKCNDFHDSNIGWEDSNGVGYG